MVDENTPESKIRAREKQLGEIESARSVANSARSQAENAAASIEQGTRDERRRIADEIATLRQQGFDTDPGVAAAKKEFFDFKVKTDFYSKIEQFEKELKRLNQQRGRAVLLGKDIVSINELIQKTENDLAALVDGLHERKDLIAEKAAALYAVMRARWTHWKLDGTPPQLTAFYFD